MMSWPETDYRLAYATGVEIAIFAPDEAPDSNPVVFVVHGLDSCMESKFGYCRELRAAGLTAIALDQRNHGRRQVNILARRESNPKQFAELLADVVGTARDIQLLIDTIPALFDLSPRCYAATGTSLGGIACLVAMTLEPRLAAVASLLGTGAFQTLIEQRMRNEGIDDEQIAAAFSGAVGHLFQQYDPINHIARFDQRPLLFTAGELDETVPLSAAQAFRQALETLRSPNQPHTFRIYPDIGHQATDEMRADAVRWLSTQ